MTKRGIHDKFCVYYQTPKQAPIPSRCPSCRRIEDIREDERQAYAQQHPPVIMTARWYHLAEWISRALRAEKALADRK